jgi:hypothetical protein
MTVSRLFHTIHRVFEIFERFAQGVTQFWELARPENEKNDAQNEKVFPGNSKHDEVI